MVEFHDKALDALEQATMDGLVIAGKQAMADARAAAPVDDEELRKSARLVKGDLAVEVKFTAPHSWLQHETLDYVHPRGGGPKYLENAVLELQLGGIVGGHVRTVLRDG